MTMRLLTTVSRCAALLVLAMICAANASAQVFQWNVANGDFLTPGNWSPPGPPDQFDNAHINNGGTATFSTDTRFVDTLEVGSAAGTTGTFAITGGELNARLFLFGEIGTATANASGGSLVSSDDIFVGGENSGGTGVLNISGATTFVTAADDFIMGRVGTGTLNFSGGLATGGYTVVGKFGTGTWNHSGGVFDQDFGDIEIGDGGNPGQSGEPGPRVGTINLTGGVIQASGHVAIGNRVGGGAVVVSGGALAATGDGNGTGTIFVGRGMDWSGFPGEGEPAEFRVIGDDGIVVANGDFSMNPENVAETSTLVAEITGPSHTPIRVTGNALIGNGDFKVELDGYNPVSGDSWTILQAGADLTADQAAVDAIVAAGGYPALTHNVGANVGTVMGTFASTDFTMAPLSAGLSWEVGYTATQVVLSVTGGPAFTADFNDDGKVDAADLGKWRNDFGASAGSDADGDGDSDGNDFLAWQRQLGSGTPATPSIASVPEPSTALLLVAGAGMIVRAGTRRRRGLALRFLLA
jgi:hypothetical protein